MTQRAKYLVYHSIIHLVFLISPLLIFDGAPLWLIAYEAFFIISLITGLVLTRSTFKSVELVPTGTELMEEGDFSSTFQMTGNPEADHLISLYNRMIRKLREERLQLEEQHIYLHKVLSVSPLGFIVLDYDRRIEFLNPSAEELLEASVEELKGKGLNEINTPLADTLDSLTTQTPFIYSHKGIRRLRCSLSEFIDRGFQRHFILIEELTEELRQSEKSAFEKLIRMMSHEVNNSVGAVSSLLNTCLHYTPQVKGADRKDFENAVSVSASRLANLNEFMQNYAEVIRLPDPRRKVKDVLPILKKCVDLFRSEFEQRGIEIIWNLDTDIPALSIDQGQMEQVFINIIKNAMEAVEDNGRITLKTGQKNGTWYIIIEDTGHGLSDEVRNNLFRPFFSTKENGQGVGLMLVQEILNRHQFDFALESHPGGPTQFTIFFF
ncbi:MAG: ATP-binding protein [Desulfobacteraceae bacterium]|jgi:nitrogen fixation/metabolism regulation signal transduction histidine kinase